MKLNIDDLTLRQIKQIQAMASPHTDNPEHPFKVGANYFIRTVTHIDIGTLVGAGDKELVLVNASWIADTGRYAQAISDGTLDEVEPYPDGLEVVIGRGAVIDACEWLHALPRKQK